MTMKVRSVAGGIAYALGGALLFGGVGVIIGIAIDPDAGLEGVLYAVVAGGGGAVLGGILGLIVFVWGGKALERQQQAEQRGRAPGGSDERSGTGPT